MAAINVSRRRALLSPFPLPSPPLAWVISLMSHSPTFSLRPLLLLLLPLLLLLLRLPSTLSLSCFSTSFRISVSRHRGRDFYHYHLWSMHAELHPFVSLSLGGKSGYARGPRVSTSTGYLTYLYVSYYKRMVRVPPYDATDLATRGW